MMNNPITLMWSLLKMTKKAEQKEISDLNNISQELFEYFLQRFNLPIHVKSLSVHLEVGEPPIFDVEFYPTRKDCSNVH